MQSFKEKVLRIWPLRMLVFLFLRPKLFISEFVYALKDYRNFRASVGSFRVFLDRARPATQPANPPGLLVVAGRGLNIHWCQIWSVMGSVYRGYGHMPYVLTSRSQPIQNLYFKLLGIRLIFIEDRAIAKVEVPANVLAAFDRLASFQDVKTFELDGVPLGKMALSTYSRLRASGIMDIEEPGARGEVREWLCYLYQTGVAGQALFAERNIQILFFGEVFMEEYGALYYAALGQRLNIVRFAGTVRDNAVVVQHLTPESDRTHFSSISKASWAQIDKCADLTQVEAEIHQNFQDRYGDRWALSKRNQPNTRIMPLEEARALLDIPAGRKVAVIYSHILYDTLFFNGEDLFANYAEWLVETVKAACANPDILWFIKVHPSNLWRGELEHFHGGKYEEVRLLEEHVGKLPDHVRFAYPDTPISPYTWLQVADYGVTVRGTSGIELGALGKPVITAGTGRYEGVGFSIDPQTAGDYLALLARLPNIPPQPKEKIRNGKLFAFATFCMKPFTLDFLKPVTRTGKERIFSSDDLVYLGNFREPMTALPASITDFVAWSLEKDRIDFLSHWSAVQEPEAAVLAEALH
jgi:hypothetical protein